MVTGRVLVLDAKSIATIAIVRSLGSKGIEVTCGEEYRACPAFFSKYVKHRIVYPSPETEPDLFVQTIRDVLRKNKYDLIIPVRDVTTVLLSQYKDEFSSYTRLPLADYTTIMKARDKSQTLKIAIKNGIPCPKTYFLDEFSIEEIREIVQYPILIRPCESSGSRGIKLVTVKEALIGEYDKVRQLYGQAFIQEYVPNEGGRYDCSALFGGDSEPRAVCQIHGIRFYPISSGPQSLAITTDDTRIIEYGTKLLKAMKWYGVANVEFLIDPRDGIPKLMEINPRFWNGVNLDIHAGVDIPYLLFKMVMEGDVEPVVKYRIGIKWRWLFPQDILWLLSSPHKLSAFQEFLKFIEKDLCYPVLSLSDPGPVLGMIIQSVKFAFNKERRDFMFKRGWQQI